MSAPPIHVVRAPSNLGLRPLTPSHEPGTWAAPEALSRAGLEAVVGATGISALIRPAYSFSPDPRSGFLNGSAIRAFNLALADAVADLLDQGRFPLVVGGDCSILLGCLAAVRRRGKIGLVHLDGHSDFRNPANFDFSVRPGTAAGADLALAIGKGEALLADWGQEGPLVEEAHVLQIGERDSRDRDWEWRDIEATGITQVDIFTLRTQGLAGTIEQARRHVATSGLPFWLHVDLDILDQGVLPAVDSPGSPGLEADELAELVHAFIATGRCLGADITIFDPEGDADGRLAREIVAMLGRAFAP